MAVSIPLCPVVRPCGQKRELLCNVDLFPWCGPFPSFPVAFIPFSLLISLPGLSPFFHHPLQLPCPHYLLSSRVPPRFGPAAGEGFQPTAPGKNPLSRSGAATRLLGLPPEYQRYAWDHRTAGKLGCSPPPPAQPLCSRGEMQGTGLAAAGSPPAGCSSRGTEGGTHRPRGPGRLGPELARRRLPGLDLSLPLVGTREDVAASRDPRPREGGPEQPPGAPRTAMPRAVGQPVPVSFPWGAVPWAVFPPVGSDTPRSYSQGTPQQGTGNGGPSVAGSFLGRDCVFLSRDS